jgi:hypothetical protein
MGAKRGQDVTKREKAEEALKAVSNTLTERLKELNSIYLLSEIVDKHPDDLPAVFQSIAAILPSAFQFPEDARARIRVGNKSYESKAFRETKCVLSVPISAKDEKKASIDVFYTKPHSFLKGEEKLLRVFSERLDKMMERVRVAEELKESEARWRSMRSSESSSLTGASSQ